MLSKKNIFNILIIVLLGFIISIYGSVETEDQKIFKKLKDLPSDSLAIKIDDNQFKISTFELLEIYQRRDIKDIKAIDKLKRLIIKHYRKGVKC
jgi:hypothetical protein